MASLRVYSATTTCSGVWPKTAHFCTLTSYKALLDEPFSTPRPLSFTTLVGKLHEFGGTFRNADYSATCLDLIFVDECIGDLAFVERTGLMPRGLASSMPMRVE